MAEPPSLQLLCQKLLLQLLRYRVRLSDALPKLLRLHAYLNGLPGDVRQEMLHTAISPSPACETDTRDHLVNNSLLLLSAQVTVHRLVYLSLPRQGRQLSTDLQLVLRHGDDLRRLAVYLPDAGTETVRHLRQLLRTCARLRQLQLVGASDLAVKRLSGYCPELRQLDVSGAGAAITDDGVKHLAIQLEISVKPPQQPALRHLNLHRTDVTQDGVEFLLDKLPLLENLGCSQLINFLEDADCEERRLNLRQLPEFQATRSHLERFSLMCPQLSFISIVLQDPTFQLQQLASLPNLQHLSLRCKDPYNFSQTQLEQLLWKLGSRLKTLSISGDIYGSIDLGCIAVNCTHLEVLKLPSLTCFSGVAARALRSVPLGLLSCLRVFEYDRLSGVTVSTGRDLNAETDALRALMCRARGLRVLRARPFPLVDADLTLILKDNPLRSLEVFEVGPAQLGSVSARRLVLECPSLCRLGRLKRWHGLDLMDIVNIRTLARRRCQPAEVKVC